jgi:hypothetical protein
MAAATDLQRVITGEMTSGNDGSASTSPVGSFQPNKWGLYDMTELGPRLPNREEAWFQTLTRNWKVGTPLPTKSKRKTGQR